MRKGHNTTSWFLYDQLGLWDCMAATPQIYVKSTL